MASTAWLLDLEFSYPMGGVFPLWSIGERERAARAAGGVLIASAAVGMAGGMVGSTLTNDQLGDLARKEAGSSTEYSVSSALARGEVGAMLLRWVIVGRVGRFIWEGQAFSARGSTSFDLPIVVLDPADASKYGEASSAADVFGIEDSLRVAGSQLWYQSWVEEVWGWPLAQWMREMAEGRHLDSTPPMVASLVNALAAAVPTELAAAQGAAALSAAVAQPTSLPRGA